MFKNKILLITGGTGSFGNAVLSRFLKTDIKEIRIFSRDEKKQDDMRNQLKNEKVKFYIGDVRDYHSIAKAMHGVDYVFHAAALKQVPSCEFFPIEATKTNVFGTQNAIDAAIAARNALSAVGGNPETALETLHQTDVSRQRTSEPAPHAVAHKRVKAGPDDAGKCGPYRESVDFLYGTCLNAEQRPTAAEKCVQGQCGHRDSKYQHAVYQPPFDLPRPDAVIRQMAVGISGCFGQSTAAAYP